MAKQLSAAPEPLMPARRQSGGLASSVWRGALRSRKAIYVVTFLSLFVVPTALGTLYFGLLASDEYVTESRFAVRTAATSKKDSDAPSALVQNTLILVEFLHSRVLVEQLDKDIGLRRLYGDDSIDYFSRIEPDAPIEKFLRFWRSMISVSVQPSGIITLTVRAFSAADATTIANAAIAVSEATLNKLDDDATADALNAALKAQQRAERQLATTRLALQEVRDRTTILDTKQSTDSYAKLLNVARGDLLDVQRQYSAQLRYLQKDNPQARLLQAKIAATKEQIAKLEAQETIGKRTVSVLPVLSDSLKELDYKSLEQGVAQAQYSTALTRVEGARLLSQVKRLYVEVFQHPVLPQEPRLPHRVLYSVLVAGASLVVWLGVLVLLLRISPRYRAV